MISERLLQFIWQFQYFNRSELQTSEGEPVQVMLPGTFNSNQGPDFSDAKIRIGETEWAGSVEIHLKTSDWNRHSHQGDRNYRNVMLHVVWENDVTGKNDSIPLLELKDRVSKILLSKYRELMNEQGFIPCEKNIHSIKPLAWTSWIERLSAERLFRKSVIVKNYLDQNRFHWEETFWWMLARNFGIQVNADAFEQMARSIPLNILARHKNQVHQLEALLFGQAGLLEGDFTEDYPQMLQKEFQFLAKKYKLEKINYPVHFLRMRPGNFPTIRLAQLAVLITRSSHLFSKIKEADTVQEIQNWFDVTANDYWHYHYRFDEPGDFRMKKPGKAMVGNIIINTICPVMFAWGNFYRAENLKEKAIRWLQETGRENNTITRGFQLLGIENKNACDSQALIELKNEYCIKKRCLDCAVGISLLK
jgi:hypothetical protein